ncbi:hypothetical protein CJ179_38545 [Rhodococcus sp. ACS1]|nr:hypothetical protein CJ179_38545 [Rhodococcus sp. ACS1]
MLTYTATFPDKPSIDFDWFDNDLRNELVLFDRLTNSEWIATVEQDVSAESPRVYEADTTIMFVWTLDRGWSCSLNELSYCGSIPSAKALDAFIQECEWQSLAEDVMRRFAKWQAITGDRTFTLTEHGTNGYSQGDEWRALILAPAGVDPKPEWDVYAAYVRGDVYGYICDDIDSSCWGYYGDDHEKSGMLDAVTNDIGAHIYRELAKQAAAAANLIKAKADASRMVRHLVSQV